MDVHLLGSRARDLLAGLARRLMPMGVAAGELTPDLSTSVETRVRFAGRTLRLWVRHRSDDAATARVLLRRASPLSLPEAVSPRVVLDFSPGAGLAAIYYAMVYPEADIYCFEADPDQLERLRVNAQRHSQRIQVFSVDWDDPEAGGPYRLGVQSAATHAVESVLAERSLDRVDVVHVDADAVGATLMRSLPAGIRNRTQTIVGRWRGTGRAVIREMLATTHVLKTQTPGDASHYVAVRNDLVPARMIARLAG